MENYKSGNPNLPNILILSIGFMFLMAAWITAAAVVQVVLHSVRVDDPTYDGDGYIAMALINGIFSLTNFITPTIVSFVGPRATLVIGPLLYALFNSSFLYPRTWFLYMASALLGFASANLWVANGMYFTRCSTKDTIGKNMGIYWSIMSVGQLLGSAYVFWQFQGMSHIDEKTRFIVGSVLTGIAIFSSTTMLFLRPPRENGNLNANINLESTKNTSSEEKKDTPSFCSTFTEPFRLLRNKHMILLIPSSMYNGLEVAFFVGLYPTSVGFTEAFGKDARKLVGFVGILTGLGTLVAGVIFGVFGEKIVKSRRYVIVAVACFCHIACSFLSYINLPNDSTLGPTKDVSWMSSPSVPVAMLCAFFLGIGDGCVTPQMCAAIGVIWPENPSAALAIYRFFQAATCAVGFFIGTLTGLHNQLLIFSAVALLGTTTFWMNEILIEKMDGKGKVNPITQIGILKRRLTLAANTEPKFY